MKGNIKGNFICSFLRKHRGALLVLLLFTIVSCQYLKTLAITSDEIAYYSYSVGWIKGHPERISFRFDSKTPIAAISLLPRIIRQVINPNYKVHDYGVGDLLLGRYCMLIYALLLGWYLYLFLLNIFNLKYTTFPLLLFFLDPLIMGYAPIIVSDIASGLFTMASIYYCCRYLKSPANKYIVFTAISIGLALVTKVSFVFILLLIIVFFTCWLFKQKPISKIRVGHILIKATLVFAIIFIVINSLYYFKDTGFKLKDKAFSSFTMQRLSSSYLINNIPVPLPFSYVQSFDLLQRNKEKGGCLGNVLSSYSAVFIVGNMSCKQPIWYYYVICLLYKTPIGIIILFMATVIMLRKKLFLHPWKDFHVFICLVVVGMFLSLSMFNSFQIGIRHLLIVYSLGYLFLAVGINRLIISYNFRGFCFIAIIFIYELLSISLYFPNLIAYTNEFLWDKKSVYKIFCDSNIDYGQLIIPKKIYKDNILYVYPTNKVVPGNYYLYVYLMHPIHCNPRDSSIIWVQKLVPTGHYCYSVLLFHVTENDIKNHK